MILAEKIVLLRKMKGMSQEELAEQLGVSRQSISKWEGAQTVPDLKRILSMAELFGVSTDTLLRDDMDLEEQLPAIPVTEETAAAATGYTAQEVPVLRQISIEEANEYLRMKNKSAGWIAIGVMLCILSPIALMQLSAAQEAGYIALTENQAAGISRRGVRPSGGYSEGGESEGVMKQIYTDASRFFQHKPGRAF